MYKIMFKIGSVTVLLTGMTLLIIFTVNKLDNKESKRLLVDRSLMECYDDCSDRKLISYEPILTKEEHYSTKAINVNEMKIEQNEKVLVKRLEVRKKVEQREKEIAELEKQRLAEIARVEEEKKKKAEEAERVRLAELEKEREIRRAEKAKQAQTQVASRGTGYQSNYEITFYTAFCPTGCTGVTASGHNVSNSIYYQGLRVVAAPPSIPLYTKLRITFSDGSRMDTIALDRGGDIQGGRLDLLVSSRDEAYRLGRQQVKVEIIN